MAVFDGEPAAEAAERLGFAEHVVERLRRDSALLSTTEDDDGPA